MSVARSFRALCAGCDYVVGLCGGIASGKSHALSVLASKGALCVDADRVAHAAYKRGTACYDRLVAEFSPAIVADDGEIDRRKLGAAVFGNRAQLDKLNGIVWPAVEEMVVDTLCTMTAAAAAAGPGPRPRVCVVEAALLLEAGWGSRCDEVWVTFIPDETAIERLVDRNGLTVEAAKARLASQMPSRDRVAHPAVTRVIRTHGTKAETRAILDAEWEALMGRAAVATAAETPAATAAATAAAAAAPSVGSASAAAPPVAGASS